MAAALQGYGVPNLTAVKMGPLLSSVLLPQQILTGFQQMLKTQGPDESALLLLPLTFPLCYLYTYVFTLSFKGFTY